MKVWKRRRKEGIRERGLLPNNPEKMSCCRNAAATCTNAATKWGENGSASTSHPSMILRKSITEKVMKVCVEWNEKERETYSAKRTLLCWPWDEKNINLHLSFIIINLKLWLVMSGKLNNMPLRR